MKTENQNASPKQSSMPVSNVDDQIVITKKTEVTETLDAGAVAEKFGYTIHPAARSFKMYGPEEHASLSEDIKRVGLRVKIAVTKDKAIVDGRNRLLGCHKAGVEPQFEVIEGEVVDAIIALNLQRRQMTESERAATILQLLNQYGKKDVEAYKLGETNDQSRQQEMKRLSGKFGVSTRIIERVLRIEKLAPEKIVDIKSGATTVGAIDALLKTQLATIKKHSEDDEKLVREGKKSLAEAFAVAERKEKAQPPVKRAKVLVLIQNGDGSLDQSALENLRRNGQLLILEEGAKVEEKAKKPFLDAIASYRNDPAIA